jgi:hypothetical protein
LPFPAQLSMALSAKKPVNLIVLRHFWHRTVTSSKSLSTTFVLRMQ